VLVAHGDRQPEGVGASLLATPVTVGGTCQVRAPSAATRRLGVARVVSYVPERSARRVTVHVDPQGQPRYLGAVDTATVTARPRPGGPTRVAATFTAAGAVARGAWWYAPVQDGGEEQHRAFAAADTAEVRHLAAAVVARCRA
jgi:hypothetical protein